MLKKLLTSIICGFVFIACTNSTNTGNDPSSQTIHANSTDTIVINKNPIIQAGCYQMIFKKDTAWLNLHIQDSVATGRLKYNRYQKDTNVGEIRGTIRDSLIVADYTFQSEGMTSVRETIFKIHNNTLEEGMGKVAIVNNKVIFTNKDSLKYDAAHPFVKVPCTSEF